MCTVPINHRNPSKSDTDLQVLHLVDRTRESRDSIEDLIEM